MAGNRILTNIVSAGVIIYLSAALPGYAQTLPDGKGRAEFQRICGTCHGVGVATKMRLSKPEWAGLVEDMVSRGAQGTHDDLQTTVNYLAANFGKDRPVDHPGKLAAAESNQVGATPAAPTPAPTTNAGSQPLSGDQLRGKGIVEASGCLGCHRVGDKGSRTGPDLSNVGANRSAEQLMRSMVAPDEEVLPENRFARVVLKDGSVVTGRLLNQDGFSVQMIDSQEQLRSFMRTTLREYTIVQKGLMPSYATKLSAEQLGDLVKYLGSLKGQN